MEDQYMELSTWQSTRCINNIEMLLQHQCGQTKAHSMSICTPYLLLTSEKFGMKLLSTQQRFLPWGMAGSMLSMELEGLEVL